MRSDCASIRQAAATRSSSERRRRAELDELVARGPFGKAGAPELAAEIEELLREAGLIEA